MLKEQAVHELLKESKNLGDKRDALKRASEKVQQKHELNTSTMALAEQRLKEQETNIDEAYVQAEHNLKQRAEVTAQEISEAEDELRRRIAEHERHLEGHQ